MALIVSAFFLVLAVVTADHFPPWISWHNEIAAFAGVFWLSGAMLVSYQAKTTERLTLPLSIGPLVFLGLLVFIQAVAGTVLFSGDAWVLAAYFTLITFSLAIGYVLERGGGSCRFSQVAIPSFARPLAELLVVLGLLSALIAMGQALEVWDNEIWVMRMPGFRRPGANLGQPNQLATLFLFSIASSIYLFELRRLHVLVALPLGGVLLLGLAITESRSGALSLLLLTVWWFVKRRKVGLNLRAPAVGLWLLLFLVCFWYWPAVANLVHEGGLADVVSVQVNTSAGTRLVVWPQLWEAVLMRPWFGWGLGQVSVAQNAVLHSYGTSEPFTYAHNVFLDLALGVGLPIAVLLAIFTFVGLWHSATRVRDPAAWYCVAVLIPFGVHSMLEFPFAYAYLLVPVMMLLGVLEARTTSNSGLRVPWWSAAVVWVFFFALTAWSVVEYIVVEEDFRVARFEAMRMGKTPVDYDRPKIILLNQLDALLEGARLVPEPNMDAKEIELFRRVAIRFPWPATQNRYALSLALNGNTEEAVRQLRVMRAMHGERAYDGVRTSWTQLAETKYPQLKGLSIP